MEIDEEALARDAAEAVRIPSETGSELPVLEWFAARASSLGLEADLHEHDLDALRAHPSYPGAEASRSSLWGLTVTLPGSLPGRIALNGHVDVVGPGTVDWRLGPWSGAVEGGRVHGRGSADMKGAVVAAMHALSSARGVQTPTVVLQVVSSEEDGGQGTFAELERDSAFDAALLPEPTDFAVVCAQAGALTFKGDVRGRTAHAAVRLEGCSAIDRYVRVHAAFAAHEAAVNRDVAHPLMRELELPYPLLVGRVSGGTWSSQVPDLVEFEGRLGVPVGADLSEARAALQAVVDRALDDGEEPCVLTWEGGAFAPGETSPDDPWVRRVRAAVEAERGVAPVVGVPYGADMRLFTARGIPAVMIGTSGLELAHAVDESVSISELGAVARIIARALT